MPSELFFNDIENEKLLLPHYVQQLLLLLLLLLLLRLVLEVVQRMETKPSRMLRSNTAMEVRRTVPNVDSFDSGEVQLVPVPTLSKTLAFDFGKW